MKTELKHIASKYSSQDFILGSLLQNHEIPEYLIFSLTIFSDLQILALTYSNALESSVKSLEFQGMSHTVLKIAKAISFDYFNFESPETTKTYFTWIGVFLLVMLFIEISIPILYYMKIENRILIKLWSGLTAFHYTTFFLLSYRLSIKYIDFFQSSSGSSTSNYFILSILYLIFSTLKAYVGAWKFYHPFDSNLRYIMRKNSVNLINLAIKIIIVPVFIFLEGDTSRWIKSSIMLILLSYKFYSLIYTYPVMSIKAFGILSIINIMQLISALIGFIIIPFDTFGDYFTHFYFILSILSCWVITHAVKKWAKAAAFMSMNEITSDSKFFFKLTSIMYLIENANTNSSIRSDEKLNEFALYSNSIISNHCLDCKVQNCGCRIILEKKATEPSKSISNADRNQIFENLYFIILKNIFEQGIANIKDNLMIKLTYAVFLSKGKNEEIIHPLLAVYSNPNMNLSYSETLMQRKLTKILEERINFKYSNNFYVDVITLYKYECLKLEFRERMYNNIDNYYQFWQSYMSDHFNIANMLEKAEKINDETLKINKLWHEMRKTHDSSSTEALEYSGYISLIANAPYSARKIEKSFYKKVLSLQISSEIITPSNLDLKCDSFVYFSLKTGKIEHASFSLDFLGFKSGEVVGKNIRQYLPFSINHIYDYLISNPSKINESSIFHQTFVTTIMNRENYLAPVSVYLAPIPQFTQDILIVCVLREIQNKENLIVVNKVGRVEGFSHDIGLALKLDPSISKINISDICNDFAQTNTNTNNVNASGKTDEVSRSFKLLFSRTFFESEPQNSNSAHRKAFNWESLENSSEMTLSFRPYKSNEKGDEYIVMIVKSSPNSYCLFLTKILDQDDLVEADEFEDEENDMTLDDILVDEEEEIIEIEQTIYKHQHKPKKRSIIRGMTKFNPEATTTKSRSRIILTKSKLNIPTTDEGNHKKSDHSQGQKQKKILDFIDNNSVGSRIDSNGKEERYFKFLEDAIYETKSIFSLKMLNICVLGHTLMSIILLIIYIVKNNNIVGSFSDIVDVIGYNREKIYWTYDNYWNGWLAYSISNDLLREGFGEVGRGYYDWLMGYYLTDGMIMLEMNNLIRKNTHKFNRDLQNYLETPLSFADIYTNQTRFGNFFQIETELGNAAIKFHSEYSTKPYYPENNNYELEFIRKNSLNSLLIASEKLFDLLAKEGFLRFDEVSNYLVSATGVIVGLSMSIYLAIFISELKFKKEKNLFIDAFLQIRPEQALEAANMSQDMRKFLQREGNKAHAGVNFYTHLDKKKHYSLQLKRKAVSFRGLYTKSHVFLFILFIFQLAIGSILFVVNDIYHTQKGKAITKLYQITDTNKMFFRFSSTFLTLYEYINTNGESLIRNKPLAEEWNKDYEILITSYRFFFALSSDDEAISRSLYNILNGDLCLEIFVNDDCSYDIPKQGLLAINSYVLNAIKQIKEAYDESDKSFAAKTAALNLEQFRKTEIVYFYNGLIAIQKIQSLLEQDIYTVIDNQKSDTLKLISIFCASFVIFTRLFWYPIWQRFVKERNAFGRIMRIIPFNIILNNGYLKAYLISYASHVLSSVKNTL